MSHNCRLKLVLVKATGIIPLEFVETRLVGSGAHWYWNRLPRNNLEERNTGGVTVTRTQELQSQDNKLSSMCQLRVLRHYCLVYLRVFWRLD
jgi:hypothetical protein